MATPTEFTKRLARISVNVERNAARTVRRAALAIDQAVVLATPVDTGRARSNWLVELDAPAQATIGAYSPGTGGSTAGANAAAAIQQGAAKVAAYRPPLNRAITISNGLPYIQRLNEGWSAQAPAGFIERGIQAGVAAVRGAKLL